MVPSRALARMDLCVHRSVQNMYVELLRMCQGFSGPEIAREEDEVLASILRL